MTILPVAHGEDAIDLAAARRDGRVVAAYTSKTTATHAWSGVPAWPARSCARAASSRVLTEW